jgi:DNA-directed RNA polymerase subunit M/transcription elongation factor TFIIS
MTFFQATQSIEEKKCPKCGERKITITEKQTRAADEPSTIYMECNACGYITINDGT